MPDNVKFVGSLSIRNHFAESKNVIDAAMLSDKIREKLYHKIAVKESGWKINGNNITWDENYTFFEFDEDLKTLEKIASILAKDGFVLDGELTWQADEPEDCGRVIFKCGEYTLQDAVITWTDIKQQSFLPHQKCTKSATKIVT